MKVLQFVLQFFQLIFQLRNVRVPDFRHFFQVAFTFELVHLHVQLVALFLDLLNAADLLFFDLPSGLQGVPLFPKVRQFLLHVLESILRGFVLLVFQRLHFDFVLANLAFQLIQFHRLRIDLHAYGRGRFVHQVNGLVRHEPLGDVPVGQLRCSHNRTVRYANTVVHLVAILQTAEDADGLIHRRFVDKNLLKPAFERTVFFDVFPVFVQGRRTDTAEFSACQRRLQHVGRVLGPLRSAGADNGMKFIDKQDDLPFRIHHFIDKRLHAILEFTAKFRSRHHRTDVQ